MNNESNTYDAIVIGSGISGGWAAKGEECGAYKGLPYFHDESMGF